MSTILYDTQIETGLWFLRRGDNRKAHDLFMSAANNSDGNQRVQALRMQANCVRAILGGKPFIGFNYEEAVDLLGQAYAETNDPILHGKIERDLALLQMDFGQFLEALETINRSIELLENGSNAEYYASVGVRGRINWLRHRKSSTVMLLNGVGDLAKADRMLRTTEDRVYELNNLMWLMRAAPARRLFGAPRAIRLSIQVGLYRLIAEALIILCLGNKNYEKIAARRR